MDALEKQQCNLTQLSKRLTNYALITSQINGESISVTVDGATRTYFDNSDIIKIQNRAYLNVWTDTNNINCYLDKTSKKLTPQNNIILNDFYFNNNYVEINKNIYIKTTSLLPYNFKFEEFLQANESDREKQKRIFKFLVYLQLNNISANSVVEKLTQSFNSANSTTPIDENEKIYYKDILPIIPDNLQALTTLTPNSYITQTKIIKDGDQTKKYLYSLNDINKINVQPAPTVAPTVTPTAPPPESTETQDQNELDPEEDI